MDSRTLRDLITILVRNNIEGSVVKAVGNQINVIINNVEFELVIRTTTAEKRNNDLPTSNIYS